MGILIAIFLALVTNGTKVITDPNGGFTSGSSVSNAKVITDPNGGFTSNTSVSNANKVITDPNGG